MFAHFETELLNQPTSVLMRPVNEQDDLTRECRLEIRRVFKQWTLNNSSFVRSQAGNLRRFLLELIEEIEGML